MEDTTHLNSRLCGPHHWCSGEELEAVLSENAAGTCGPVVVEYVNEFSLTDALAATPSPVRSPQPTTLATSAPRFRL